MSTAMSKAESNALVVSYDVLGTHVELDLDFVKKYLVRGRAELVSNQELVFFMNTCRQQKLNPLVQGEVYLIKYSKDDPAQMVVGKDAYLRRAFDHPDYLFKNDGITVQRGNEIIQKEGCCLYPGETLVGGWCRVTFMRNGKERTAFKEVAFAEYNKGKANWNSKPATMINKVAVSQCVRDAFPKDYEGVYSEDEMIASGAIPVDYKELDDQKPEEQPAEEEDPVISQEQRQQLFKAAQANFGKDKGNAVVKPTTAIIKSLGDSYGYSIQEMRASAMAGKSLDARKAESARYQIDYLNNKIAWNGDEETGLRGVLSKDNDVPLYVPATGAKGSTKWADKTEDEILADITGMLKQVARTTKKVEKPDTLALPSEAYIEIQNRRIESTATTVLKYVQDNIKDIARIVSCPELDPDSVDTNPYAAESDGKGVALLFKNDPRKFTIENPLSFMQYPVQPEGLEMVVPCEARTAGAIIYYPMSMLIATGIC